MFLQFLVSVFASFGSILYGYDLGAIAEVVAAPAFAEYFHSPTSVQTWEPFSYLPRASFWLCTNTKLQWRRRVSFHWRGLHRGWSGRSGWRLPGTSPYHFDGSVPTGILPLLMIFTCWSLYGTGRVDLHHWRVLSDGSTNHPMAVWWTNYCWSRCRLSRHDHPHFPRRDRTSKHPGESHCSAAVYAGYRLFCCWVALVRHLLDQQCRCIQKWVSPRCRLQRC